jgi:hypothetical protein
MKQRDIGEVFLFNFIKSIAQVSRNQSKIMSQIKKEENFQKEIKEKKSTIEMIPTTIKKINTISKHSLTTSQQIPINLKKQEYSSQYLLSRNKDINQRPVAERLNFLIKDPAVTEIECRGSDQTLLVKKAGIIQKTNIKISIEEIYQLIAEFSQKTKIPVIDGTLKAATNNLIITAVLSEILDPRFILQKKNPFQQFVPN